MNAEVEAAERAADDMVRERTALANLQIGRQQQGRSKSAAVGMVTRIGVGGPLHGAKLCVESNASMFVFHAPTDVRTAIVDQAERKRMNLAAGTELLGYGDGALIYRALLRGGVPLLIEDTLYRSRRDAARPGQAGLDETIVSALGDAAGVRRPDLVGPKL